MALLKRICCIIVLLGVLVPTGALAQGTQSMRINYSEVFEGADSLQLDIYYTIIEDATGQAVTDAQIESAEVVLLEDGSHYSAQVKKADTPFYITLVLDASGSMARAGEDLRNAAKQALNNSPQGARFSVIRFNDRIDVLRDFTEDEDSVARAIDQVEPVANAGTCLYDAIYTAVELLGKTPAGRRAIVLFTDGRDETLNQGPCSQHTYDEAISLAIRPDLHVPIHAIGLSGNQSRINASELESMASTTGGFSAVGGQSSLSSLFEQIMDALNSQWLATSFLYPTQGRHEAAIQVRLKDGTILSATVSFESSRAYSVPASLTIDRVEYNAERDIYTLYFFATSAQLIDHINVAVWDVKNGVQVAEYTFTGLSNTSAYEISNQGLQSGKEYEFRISALTAAGEPVKDVQGNPIEMVHEVTYSPTVLKTKVSIASVILQPLEIVINIQVENGQQVSRYEGWLNDDATKTLVPTTTFTITSLPADNSIHIPMLGVQEGKYTIVFRALGFDGTLLSEADYKGVAFTPPVPPPPPSRISVIMGQILDGLRARPWIIVVMILVILVGMLGLISIPLIARRQTGTPVLQGKLEANLGPKGQNLPINLTRVIDQPPAPVRAPAPQPVAAAPSATIRVAQTPDPASQGKAVRIYHQSPFTMGREECGLNFSGDRKVSRKHAVIAFDMTSNTFFITDLGSVNGVWVNGVRIQANRPVPLSKSATVNLGPDTRLVFERIA